MQLFFSSLKDNFIHSFTGYRWIGHGIAIILTYIIVTTGLDWQYYLATRNPTLNALFFPGIIIGGILPLFGLPVLLALGTYYKSKKTTVIAWTLGQAAVLGWLISSIYKAFTGRVQPTIDLTIDSSRQFNFGFWEHGIFWGWPSSHTTVAFAMAVALIVLLRPRKKSAQIVAFIYALYIGISVSLSIHWLSEFIAGAIIGTMIGLSVGYSFKKYFNF